MTSVNEGDSDIRKILRQTVVSLEVLMNGQSNL